MLRNNNKTNPNRVASPTKSLFLLGRMSRSGSSIARTCLLKHRQIGLIILFAVSMVMAGGRKPKEVMVNASLRPLSVNEVMEILQKFPEMVPDRYKDGVFNKEDKYIIEGLFHFREVEDADLLKRFFPTVRFIKASKFTKPPLPYLMAVSGNKRYENFPSLFN
ncbi:MAG: hypothetical protein ABIK33_06615, partial [candidate division WOR-3 bacterium]